MSNKLIKEIGETSGYSYEACLYLIKTYGHILISLFVILLISFMLNVATWTGIIIITSMILRAFSGGAHSKSKITCTLISLVYPIGCGLLINNFIPFSSGIVITISLIMFILGLFVLITYAPADTPQKPIISLEFKRQLKKKSIVFLTVMELALIILYGIKFEYFYQVGLSILCGLTWQLFTITPVGYYSLRLLDKMFYHK
jgi:accessory gene regulator B